MSWKCEVERTGNGFIIRNLDPEEPRVTVFEDRNPRSEYDHEDVGDLYSFENVIYCLRDFFGIRRSKYDKYQVLCQVANQKQQDMIYSIMNHFDDYELVEKDTFKNT